MSERALVVVFGGAGREATVVAARDAGWTIEQVLWPDRAGARLSASVGRLAAAGLPVRAVTRATLDAALGACSAPTLLSVGFPFLLLAEAIARFKVCINVHPSLLPKYRGPTTGAHVLINGESESGVTVHLIDEGMDTGAIVAQGRFEVTAFDTVRSVQRKAYALGPSLVVQALERLETESFSPWAQDESMATIYPKRRWPKDSEVDPSRSLTALYNEIRGSDPDDFPAHFFVEGQKVCIRLWRPERPSDEDDTI